MRHDRLGFALTLATAWAAAAAILVEAPVGVTAPLGLLLVALPGWAWFRAVHPAALPRLETFAAVAATALGLLVVTALVLNLLPDGLRPTSWAIALAVLTTVGETVATSRGVVSASPAIRLRSPTRRQATAIAGGLMALVAASTVSIVSGHTSADEQFTELSLVPRGSPHPPRYAVLLITNHEDATVRYRLDYTTARATIIHKVTLPSGGEYRQVEPVRAGAASATLYRDASTTPYRHVWIGDPNG